MLVARSQAEKKIQEREVEFQKTQAATQIQKALVKGAYVKKKMRKDLPALAGSHSTDITRRKSMPKSPGRSQPQAGPALVNAQVQTDDVEGLPPLGKLKQQSKSKIPIRATAFGSTDTSSPSFSK